MALDEPELSPRELAARFTDTQNYFVSEATVYRPVSYTHLRAHETVLDIVCRLLLEKKQKTFNDSV